MISELVPSPIHTTVQSSDENLQGVVMTDVCLKPIHILLVDDNPNNLKVLSEVIQGYNWKALMANDGEAAIEQAEYAHPDLILLDVMMPGFDGFETCRRLKSNSITQNIPIIFMTALSDTTDKVKGLAMGAVDYITKPFQQEEVIARIKLHLQLAQLTQRLEEKVQERTAKLTQSLHQLQQAQLQLVQSEKMSSLGQMIAGVAHEINNPVNFIHGNLTYIDHYTQDLLKVIQAYQTHYPQPPETLQAVLEAVEIDFLHEDLVKLLRSMKVGTDRICEIVLSLRNFSRLDEAECKAVDIHEGIDNTLVILRQRLKAKATRPEIQISKEYGQLPLVECYAGQLNQVFMNILSNAIDALEESNQGKAFEDIIAKPNIIHICTHIVDRQQVAITISDNGTGIPEHVRSRLFDPFFTTKPVNKGTGLGLSISYQIVTEKHGGKLWCDSIPHQGTKFVIEIPKVIKRD